MKTLLFSLVRVLKVSVLVKRNVGFLLKGDFRQLCLFNTHLISDGVLVCDCKGA